MPIFTCFRRRAASSQVPPQPGALGERTVHPIPSQSPCLNRFFKAIGNFFKSLFCCCSRPPIDPTRVNPNPNPPPSPIPASPSPNPANPVNPVIASSPSITPSVTLVPSPHPTNPANPVITPPVVTITSVSSPQQPPAKETVPPPKEEENISDALKNTRKKRMLITLPSDSGRAVLLGFGNPYVEKLLEDGNELASTVKSSSELLATFNYLRKEVIRGNALIEDHVKAQNMGPIDPIDPTSLDKWIKSFDPIIKSWKFLETTSALQASNEVVRSLEEILPIIQQAVVTLNHPSLGELKKRLIEAFNQTAITLTRRPKLEAIEKARVIAALNTIAHVFTLPPIPHQNALGLFILKREQHSFHTPVNPTEVKEAFQQFIFSYENILMTDIEEVLCEFPSLNAVEEILQYVPGELKKMNTQLENYTKEQSLEGASLRQDQFETWSAHLRPYLNVWKELLTYLDPNLENKKAIDILSKLALQQFKDPPSASFVKIKEAIATTFDDAVKVLVLKPGVKGVPRAKMIITLNNLAQSMGLAVHSIQQPIGCDFFIAKREKISFNPSSTTDPTIKLFSRVYSSNLLKDLQEAFKSISSPEDVQDAHDILTAVSSEFKKINKQIKQYAKRNNIPLLPSITEPDCNDPTVWKSLLDTWEDFSEKISQEAAQNILTTISSEFVKINAQIADYTQKNGISFSLPLLNDSDDWKTNLQSLVETWEALFESISSSEKETQDILTIVSSELVKINILIEKYAKEQSILFLPSLTETTCKSYADWKNNVQPLLNAWEGLIECTNAEMSTDEILRILMAIKLPQGIENAKECPYAPFGALKKCLIDAFNKTSTKWIQNQEIEAVQKEKIVAALNTLASALNLTPMSCQSASGFLALKREGIIFPPKGISPLQINRCIPQFEAQFLQDVKEASQYVSSLEDARQMLKNVSLEIQTINKQIDAYGPCRNLSEKNFASSLEPLLDSWEKLQACVDSAISFENMCLALHSLIALPKDIELPDSIKRSLNLTFDKVTQTLKNRQFDASQKEVIIQLLNQIASRFHFSSVPSQNVYEALKLKRKEIQFKPASPGDLTQQAHRLMEAYKLQFIADIQAAICQAPSVEMTNNILKDAQEELEKLKLNFPEWEALKAKTQELLTIWTLLAETSQETLTSTDVIAMLNFASEELKKMSFENLEYFKGKLISVLKETKKTLIHDQKRDAFSKEKILNVLNQLATQFNIPIFPSLDQGAVLFLKRQQVNFQFSPDVEITVQLNRYTSQLVADLQEVICNASSVEVIDHAFSYLPKELRRINESLREFTKNHQLKRVQIGKTDLPGWNEWEKNLLPMLLSWKKLLEFQDKTFPVKEVCFMLGEVGASLPQAIVSSPEKCPYSKYGKMHDHLILACNSLITYDLTYEEWGLDDRDRLTTCLNTLTTKLCISPIKLDTDMTEAIKNDAAFVEELAAKELAEAVGRILENPFNPGIGAPLGEPTPAEITQIAIAARLNPSNERDYREILGIWRAQQT